MGVRFLIETTRLSCYGIENGGVRFAQIPFDGGCWLSS